MLKITIREAQPGDVAGIAAVLRDELSHHIGLMPERFRMTDPVLPDGWLDSQLAQDNRRLFVAMLDEQVVGVALIRIETDDHDIAVPRQYAYINELGVLETHRGQGIGQQLMRYIETWALEMGMIEIELNVWESNTGARRFYERLGYETLSRRLIRRLG